MDQILDSFGYEAATANSAYFIYKNGGYLRIFGPDRVDFLQRQTTSDIRLLKSGQSLLSVLTSPTARILDVFYLIEEEQPEIKAADQPTAISILTLPGKGPDTFLYLKSRIFFMDKVTLTDQSEAYLQVDLVGPQAGLQLQNLGITELPTMSRYIKLTLLDLDLQILELHHTIGSGYRLIVAAEAADKLLDLLKGLGIPEISPQVYEIIRIEAGFPAGGHELIEAFTPLETGLRTAVSDTKGCYTGQEIIARQITYDKVNQSLCGLCFTTNLPDGTAISVNDKPVGVLTSIAQSPRFGDIGLAIIKRPYHLPGTTVQIGSSQALVHDLPFR